MEHAEHADPLMPGRPVAVLPRIVVGPARTVWPVARIPVIETVARHRLPGLERARIAGEQVVQVHGLRVDVFQIVAPQLEGSGVRSGRRGLEAYEMRSPVGGIEILALARPDVRLVPGGGSIE